MTRLNDIMLEQVAQQIAPGSRLLRAWPMGGGVSAQVTALEIEQPDGQTKKLIVRRHGPADLAHNPHIAADEFRLLQLLQSAGLPTPAPYALDRSGALCPTPYLALEYIEGAPPATAADVPDLTLQLATQLARVHAIDGVSWDLSFLPQQGEAAVRLVLGMPPRADQALDEARIRAILRSAWPLPPRNPSVLLHGDFWPGNTLWRDGRLVAIVDWEDAQVGDPLADVANTRLELLWAYGADAMQRFTEQYRSITAVDLTHLPYWDLCAALRHMPKIAAWGLDSATEQAMRGQLSRFVSQAFGQLAAR